MKVRYIKKTLIDKEVIVDWISSDNPNKCFYGFALAKGRSDINLYDKLYLFEKWKNIMSKNTELPTATYAGRIIINMIKAFDGVDILTDNGDFDKSLKHLKNLIQYEDLNYNFSGINVAKKHQIPDKVLNDWLLAESDPLGFSADFKFIAAAFNKITKDPNITTVYEILENAPASFIKPVVKYCIKVGIAFPDLLINQIAFKYHSFTRFWTDILLALRDAYNYSHKLTYDLPTVANQSFETILIKSFSPPKNPFIAGDGGVIARISIPDDSYIRGSWHVGGRASHVIIDHIDGHLFGQPILIPPHMYEIGYLSPGDELEILDFDLSFSLSGSGIFFSNTIDQVKADLVGVVSDDMWNPIY